MAPTAQVSGSTPNPMFHASAGDRYGIPHRNVPQHDQTRPLHTRQDGRSNGAGTPRARLLTVDEALQFSPLSSIVPFHSGMQISVRTSKALILINVILLDIIPAPTASFSAPHPLFPTTSEQRAARQSLDLLDKDILRTKGQSSLAQKALSDLKPCMRRDDITEL